MAWFPLTTRVWRALPARACSGTESASLLRILAACDLAKVDAPPMLAAWAESQRPAQADRIRAMAGAIARGMPLSEVMVNRRSTIRDDHAVAARFAARSGLLPEVSQAAIETDSPLSWRYRVAIGYLSIVLVMFLGVAAFLSVSIMPQWLKILNEFGMDPPPATRIAQRISVVVVAASAIVPLVVTTGIVLVVSRRLRRWLAWPFQAGQRRAAAVDLLGVAVAAGRPLEEAAEVLAECQVDRRLARRLETMATGREGLARSGLVRAVEAEQLQRLTTAADRGWLLRTAAARRREQRRRRWTLAAELLVPAAVAVMGLLVLVEAFAVLGPLQQLVKELA